MHEEIQIYIAFEFNNCEFCIAGKFCFSSFKYNSEIFKTWLIAMSISDLAPLIGEL